MGSVGKFFSKVVSAVVKIVRVIVKVIKFVVKAIVNFVKGVFSGDIGSIIMLVAIIFTFGAALGFFGPLLTISMTTAVVSTGFTILASEYQRQKAVKMQEQAEKDLERQSDEARADLAVQAKAEEERLQAHFDKMEGDRYKGYESGQFGIGSFEPEGVLPSDEDHKNMIKKSNNLGIVMLGLMLGGSLAYGMSEGEHNG